MSVVIEHNIVDYELESRALESQRGLKAARRYGLSRVAGPEYDVLQADDRRRVRNTTMPPFRFICKLEMEFADPRSGAISSYLGTGALVRPNKVLTAAHCLFDREQGFGLARRIRVIPGKNGPGQSRPEEPGGSRYARRLDFPTQWRTAPYYNGAWPFDYGMITLEKPFPQSWGWWPRIRNLSDAFLRRYRFNTSGYPGDKRGNHQYWVYDRVVNLQPGRLEFTHDIMGGQSGSPIWVRWQGFRAIVGIVTAHDDRRTTVAANRGVRITGSVLADIARWLRN